MTQKQVVERWEQAQDMLREVLLQFGYEAVADKQPDSGVSSARDPHRWWDAAGVRLLASFYSSEDGELVLHEADCDPAVAHAFEALRSSKRGMH